jgi:hypothetical protein
LTWIASVPEFTDLHILTGLLLPIWKRLPNDSMTFQAAELAAPPCAR